jgi:hypothetical protein
MKLKLVATFVVSAVLAISAIAQEVEVAANGVAQSDLDRAAALIRSKSDLHRYLADKSRTNPLNKLSEGARTRLADSVVWGKGGRVASFYVDDINRELGPTDAYRILQLFGFQSLGHSVNNGSVKSELDRFVLESSGHGVLCPRPPCSGGPVANYGCNIDGCDFKSGSVCDPTVCKGAGPR